MLLFVCRVYEVLNNPIAIISQPIVKLKLIHFGRCYDAHCIREKSSQLIVHNVFQIDGADNLGENNALLLHVLLIILFNISTCASFEDIRQDAIAYSFRQVVKALTTFLIRYAASSVNQKLIFTTDITEESVKVASLCFL